MDYSVLVVIDNSDASQEVEREKKSTWNKM